MDYTQITYRSKQNELRFSREDGHNPTAMRLKLDTLKFDGFSINEHGNLYSLVMKTKKLSFPKALRYVAETLGLEKSQFSQKIRYPFGGFYKGLMKEIQEPEYSMTTYDESILDENDWQFIVEISCKKINSSNERFLFKIRFCSYISNGRWIYGKTSKMGMVVLIIKNII